MDFQPTAIHGLYTVSTKRLGDDRGSFARFYCRNEMERDTGSAWQAVQINHSHSKTKGTLRGLHFQNAPALESKMVRCIRGSVFDVAVDLRAGSPTFLHHVSIELSAANGLAFLIPAGCAHGFQTLEDDCEMLYLHSTTYAKEHEGGVRYDDPLFNIPWPMTPTVLSDRDKNFAYLNKDFKGLDNAL